MRKLLIIISFFVALIANAGTLLPSVVNTSTGSVTVSDKLIVASDLSKGVCKEIDFANLVGMEVEYLEDTK